MKRQKIQRELMKLEQENMDKREEIIIKKEVLLPRALQSAIVVQWMMHLVLMVVGGGGKQGALTCFVHFHNLYNSQGGYSLS